jgi:hypothetical protein
VFGGKDTAVWVAFDMESANLSLFNRHKYHKNNSKKGRLKKVIPTLGSEELFLANNWQKLSPLKKVWHGKVIPTILGENQVSLFFDNELSSF